MPAVYKQKLVQQEIKKVYDNYIEQQKYVQRQLEAHAQQQNNFFNQIHNPGFVEPALNRRQLNIEEEEKHSFHSDEEEDKSTLVEEYAKLFRQPQPNISLPKSEDMEEAKQERRKLAFE